MTGTKDAERDSWLDCFAGRQLKLAAKSVEDGRAPSTTALRSGGSVFILPNKNLGGVARPD